MGKIGQGILGGLSGKVGNIIGASWKGINYIRIKPVSVANPRTPGQVNQRNKFSATLEFLQPLIGFVNLGYKFYKNKQSAFNAAMSYVLTNAITGSAPDFTVDYPVALLSRGSLSGPLQPSMTMGSGEVQVGWVNNSGSGNAVATDVAMLVVYNPAKKDAVSMLEGASRITGTEVLAVPADYVDDTVHVYMAFISADGNQVSDSVHVGSGVVVA